MRRFLRSSAFLNLDEIPQTNLKKVIDLHWHNCGERAANSFEPSGIGQIRYALNKYVEIFDKEAVE